MTVSHKDVLRRRQLNRATLDRQLLLGRRSMPVVDAVAHLCGVQAQLPLVPYTTLWTRLDDFEPAELAAGLRDRSLVRAALMRSTVHLVTAADALRFRPPFQVVMARTFASTAWARTLRDQAADLDAILGLGRELVEASPHNRPELAVALAERFPGVDAEAMSFAVTYLVPVLQPTPRGVWGERGQARWVSVESWLSDTEIEPIHARDLVLRYLGAHGPASVKDIQAWCGLTRLREVVDSMDDRLRRYSTEDGAELVDLAEATVPDADVPAPVRFLPEYDNAVLGYADRRRMVGDGEHRWLSGGPGGAIGSVLVDGMVQATWALRREGLAARLEVHASVPLGRRQHDEVEREAARLLDLLAADATPEVWWSG